MVYVASEAVHLEERRGCSCITNEDIYEAGRAAPVVYEAVPSAVEAVSLADEA
jgi:hypothetical protein